MSRAPKLVEFDGMHHGHGHSAHGGSPMMHHGLSDSGLEAGGSGAQVQASAQQHAQHLSPAARELADRLCVLAMDNMRAFDGGFRTARLLSSSCGLSQASCLDACSVLSLPAKAWRFLRCLHL